MCYNDNPFLKKSLSNGVDIEVFVDAMMADAYMEEGFITEEDEWDTTVVAINLVRHVLAFYSIPEEEEVQSTSHRVVVDSLAGVVLRGGYKEGIDCLNNVLIEDFGLDADLVSTGKWTPGEV